jgi:crotonobetainyl-CoA:carnitine CoA-transferase CaiB-like acyl-CoA transferase
MGSAHPLNAPYQAFATADGWIVVGGSNQKNWLNMLKALDAEALAADPRFAENADRMAHLAQLEAALLPYFKRHASADLLARFEAEGVPAGPIYDMLQMQADSQVKVREMVVEVEHARLGPVKTLGLPVKFSKTPGRVATGAPVYGQHTREVLRAHDFSDAEIDALLAEGAIATADPR